MVDPRSFHVAVVGGGITGLAAAYRLSSAGLAVTLFERAGRLGGKIRTHAGRHGTVEYGPDAFLTSKPQAVDLCRELGVPTESVAPATVRALVMRAGRLHPLPEGLRGIAPTRIGPLLRSPLVGAPGALRAAIAQLVPRPTGDVDQPVAEVVRRRYGRQVWERLVEPLATGVLAGDGETLSTLAAFPSLLAGAPSRAPTRPSAAGPAFARPQGGMHRLVAALRDRLDRVDLRESADVTTIERDGTRYRLTVADQASCSADGVVLALPSFDAARLVATLDPELSSRMESIPHTSTAVVAMCFPPGAARHLPETHGYVIPRAEGRPVLACSMASSKFPDPAHPEQVVIRVFVGRRGEPDPLRLTDDELVALARDELRMTLGLDTAPESSQVARWQNGLPHYPVGHLDLLESIESRLVELPGLAIAGHSYHGVGIPDCIASAERAATRILQAYGRNGG